MCVCVCVCVCVRVLESCIMYWLDCFYHYVCNITCIKCLNLLQNEV